MYRELATGFLALGVLALPFSGARAADPSPMPGPTPAYEPQTQPPASPPLDDYAFNGAILDTEGCYDNTLHDGGWIASDAEVGLPFTIRINGNDFDTLTVHLTGALTPGPTYVPDGNDNSVSDNTWAMEVFAPMLAENSARESRDDGTSTTPVYYGFTSYHGHQAFCATWLNVSPFTPIGPPTVLGTYTSPYSGVTETSWGWHDWGFDYSLRNSFQALIVDRSDRAPGDFDVVYNYDRVEWQTATGGMRPTYSDSPEPTRPWYLYAEAGWSLGMAGTWCYGSTYCWTGYIDGRAEDAEPLPAPESLWWSQVTEDGTYDTYLDSSPTGLPETSTGSGIRGRHVFEIKNPVVVDTPGTWTSLLDGDNFIWVGHWTGDRQYVALGDSYQSGEGAGDYLAGTNDRQNNMCHRSANAFSARLDKLIPSSQGVVFDFWSCSGAIIDDLRQETSTSGRDGSPPWNDPDKDSAYFRVGEPVSQSSLDRLGPETWAVTLGIGGNDVGFVKTLEACVGGTRACTDHDVGTTQAIIDQGLRYDILLDDIELRAPNATVFFVGYPRFFISEADANSALQEVGGSAAFEEWFAEYTWAAARVHNGSATPGDLRMDAYYALIDGCANMTRSEQLWINDKIEQLNTEIQRAALRNGAIYIDIFSVGEGREICRSADTSEWFMNGLNDRSLFIWDWLPPFQTPFDPQSFHPNSLGHELIAEEFTRQLAEPTLSQEPFILRGETKTYFLDVGGSAALRISTVWGGSDVNLTITSPSGILYSADYLPEGSVYRGGPRFDYFEIPNPEVGQWKVEARGTDLLPGGESFKFASELEPLPNALPVGSIALVQTGNTIEVTATGASDPDGTIVDYWWDFGDSGYAHGISAGHTFTEPGEKSITLILTDDRGGKTYVTTDSLITVRADAFGNGTAVGKRTFAPAAAAEPGPSITGDAAPSPSTTAPADPAPGATPGVVAADTPADGTSNGGAGGLAIWLWTGLGLLVTTVFVVGGRLLGLPRRSSG
jgi:hypothetical protein